MTTMRLLLLGVASAAVLTACDDTRSITTEPGAGFGFGASLGKPAASNIPRGIIRFPVAGRLASTNPANDSIVVTLITADTLAAGSQYVVWAANDSATRFYRLTGNLEVTRTDTTQASTGDLVFSTTTTNRTGINGWGVGGPNVTARFSARRAGQAGLANTDSIGLIIVSTETGTVGAAPGPVRSVWGRFSQAASSQTAIRFGTFAPRLDDEFRYATSAVPAITPRGRVELRDGVLVVIDSNYFKPPRGYFYAAFALKVDSLSGRPLDTLYLGARTGPAPERVSMFDADTDASLTRNDVIVAMNQRVKLDTTVAEKLGPAEQPLKEYGFVNIVLQSKAAPLTRMGSGIIMQVLLPPSIRGR